MREDELWELDELESDEEELWELDKLESASLDSNARGTTGKRAHDASCSSDESNLGERPSKKGPGRYSNFLAHEDAELFFFAFDDDGAASGANRHDGLPVAKLRWAPRDAEFTRFTAGNARVPNTVAGRRKLQRRLHCLIKRHEADGAEFLSAMHAARVGNVAFTLELEAGLGLGGPRAAECNDCGAWDELPGTAGDATCRTLRRSRACARCGMAVSPVQVMTVLAFVLLVVCHVPWDALLRGAGGFGGGGGASAMKLLRLSSPAAKLVIALAGHKVLRLYGRALKYGVTVRRVLVAWVMVFLVNDVVMYANPNHGSITGSLKLCADLVETVLSVALISIAIALRLRSRYRDITEPPPRVSCPV